MRTLTLVFSGLLLFVGWSLIPQNWKTLLVLSIFVIECKQPQGWYTGNQLVLKYSTIKPQPTSHAAEKHGSIFQTLFHQINVHHNVLVLQINQTTLLLWSVSAINICYISLIVIALFAT